MPVTDMATSPSTEKRVAAWADRMREERRRNTKLASSSPLPSSPSVKSERGREGERMNSPPLPLAVPHLPRQPQNYTLVLLSCLKS